MSTNFVRERRSSVETYLASHVIASFRELNAAPTLSIGTFLPIATSLEPSKRLSTFLVRPRLSWAYMLQHGLSIARELVTHHASSLSALLTPRENQSIRSSKPLSRSKICSTRLSDRLAFRVITRNHMLAVHAPARRHLVLELFALVIFDILFREDVAELARVHCAGPRRWVLVLELECFVEHLAHARDAYEAFVDVDAGVVVPALAAAVAVPGWRSHVEGFPVGCVFR